MWCIPLLVGVHLIGALILIYAILVLIAIFGFTLVGVEILWWILYLIELVPILLAAFFWVKWLMNDSADTRARLSKSCLLMIFSCLLHVVISMLEWFAYSIDGFTFGNFLIVVLTSSIWCLFYFYSAGVCLKFSTQP